MTAAVIALTVVVVLLVVALVVTTTRLSRARAEAERLRRRLEAGSSSRRRSRLLPTPSDAVKTAIETAVLVKDKGLGGAFRSSIDDILGWAEVERPDLARMAARDGTVTMMFSDIEDSTALNSRLGDRLWVRLLAKHDKIVRACVEAESGRVIKTQGDGFMVAFAEPTQAVTAAIAIQRRLTDSSGLARIAPIRVRIGAHKGSVVHRDGDLFGRHVAYAARVAAQADGGEVLVSDTVLQALGDDVVRGNLVVGESRRVELKGIQGVQVVHLIEWDT